MAQYAADRMANRSWLKVGALLVIVVLAAVVGSLLFLPQTVALLLAGGDPAPPVQPPLKRSPTAVAARAPAGDAVAQVAAPGTATADAAAANVDPAAGAPASSSSIPLAAPPPPSNYNAVEIGIAYGTEKQYWLQAALKAFNRTPDGKRVKVKLIPMGSIEGAHAVLQGDKRIHVWSPASAMYRAAFEQEWRNREDTNPILSEDRLALTPMVFVMWKPRYEAFLAKYSQVSFRTLGEAIEAPGGWGAIANHPDWGLFKLGYTHPNQSNSGLMTLILLAYDFQNKSQGLKTRDIMDPSFQHWVGLFARGAAGLSNSTGNLMRDMVLKGPSTFDALIVYESVAIEYLGSAEDRWEPLQVVYPKVNVWNDNPYYVLNVPWSSPAQRAAAETFLKFLMSADIQRLALDHGFRPGDPKVPVRFPESPFVKFERYGLSVELSTICEYPSNEVIDNLQQSWLRAAGMRGQ